MTAPAVRQPGEKERKEGGGEEGGGGGGEGGHTDRDRQTDRLKQEKTALFLDTTVWGHSRG